jgi:uncharacterized RDD family membrane protein YckC
MALPDQFLRIDTPENVVFGYEVVGIGSRFMAAVVDTLLIAALQLVVNLTLLLLTGGMARVSDGPAWIAAVLGLVSFGLLWGYYIFFEMLWNGQSPGKRWVGLRVIRTDGAPVSLTESIVRNLVRLVDFLPLFYGVGVVTMFINDQARRLGDLAAGTLVVREQTAVTLDSILATRPPAPGLHSLPSPADAQPWPVHLLTAEAVQLAESFLRRQGELSNSDELAAQIARRLLAQMGLPDHSIRPAEAPALLYRLVQVRRAYERGEE